MIHGLAPACPLRVWSINLPSSPPALTRVARWGSPIGAAPPAGRAVRADPGAARAHCRHQRQAPAAGQRRADLARPRPHELPPPPHLIALLPRLALNGMRGRARAEQSVYRRLSSVCGFVAVILAGRHDSDCHTTAAGHSAERVPHYWSVTGVCADG